MKKVMLSILGAVGVYVASYLILMADVPAVNKQGQITYKSSFRLASAAPFRLGFFYAFTEESFLNRIYKPLDQIYFKIIDHYKKLDLILKMQQISQLPTGEMCVAFLGDTVNVLDSDDQFSRYKQFNDVQIKQYLSDKKIYMWWGPMYTYIVAVIDKQSDKVVFVTHFPM